MGGAHGLLRADSRVLVGTIASFVLVAFVALVAITAWPANGEAQSNGRGGGNSGSVVSVQSFAVRDALSVLALGEACQEFTNVQSGGFTSAGIEELQVGIRGYPIPDGIASSMDVLINEDASPASRSVAAKATERFFNGACGNPDSPLETICMLRVTLADANVIQLGLLTAQMQFVLHDNADSIAVSEALTDALIALPTGDPTTDTQALDTVVSELKDACAGIPSADTDAPTTEPQTGGGAADGGTTEPAGTLPNTGIRSVTEALLRYALAAIAMGAFMMGFVSRRENQYL